VRLLIATTNHNKLREIRGLLASVPAELMTLASLPPVAEPEETGATFQDNARLKALYYDRHMVDTLSQGMVPVGMVGPQRVEPTLTVAEDSGLVIDALEGEPGVRSARYLRAEASYDERFEHILRQLEQRPGAPRTARFICAMTVVARTGPPGDPSGRGEIVFETTGIVEGEIADRPRGTAGFGYDPLFYFPPYGCTLAEVGQEEKLSVAHRGQAFRSLARWLAERGDGGRG
jgi:XTP/dITP diphosphohydrolase